jgi:P27 family predicted phage terminase small subunit
MARRPKPTILKLADGLPGHRLPNPLEPTPVPGAPAMPDGLDVGAVAEWNDLMGLLDALGLLSRDVGPIAAIYLRAWTLNRDARADIAKYGAYSEGPRGRRRHPAFVTVRETETILIRCLVELGLTPSARTGVRRMRPVDSEPDLAAFARSRNEPWTKTVAADRGRWTEKKTPAKEELL